MYSFFRFIINFPFDIGCTENRFLQPEFISNALKAVNPVVLGFQVERIVLSTISQSGLDGVPVSKVEYFNDASDLMALFASASTRNTLYIPNAWNYPRIDAVFVSHHKPESIIRKTAKQKTANQTTSPFSAVPFSTATLVQAPTTVSHSSASSASNEDNVGHVSVQFIQISVAFITNDKLTQTRGILHKDCPELALWHHAVPNSNADVRFSIRWLVSSDQVVRIPKLKHVVEKVSALESVNSALKL
jgi:hypothetical protein